MKVRVSLAIIYFAIVALAGVIFFAGKGGYTAGLQGRFEAHVKRTDRIADEWKVGEVYTAERDAEVNSIFQEAMDFQVSTAVQGKAISTRMLMFSGTASLLTLLALFLIMRNLSPPRPRVLGLFAGHGLAFICLLMLAGAAGYSGRIFSGIDTSGTWPPSVARFLTNTHKAIGQPYLAEHDRALMKLLKADNGVSQGVAQVATSLTALAGSGALGVIVLTAVNALVAFWPMRRGQEGRMGQ